MKDNRELTCPSCGTSKPMLRFKDYEHADLECDYCGRRMTDGES